MNIAISIIITTFSEGQYLDELLQNISRQTSLLEFEVLLLEAGDYDIERAKCHLGCAGHRLRFFKSPGMSRTAALNHLCHQALGDIIVRLDARSRVSDDYLETIYNLSRTTNAANVGGVMAPVWRGRTQEVIAKIMQHPLSFGGAKARNMNYRGAADSVYLGAFNRNIVPLEGEWFDSKHPKISEDSDVNFRIRRLGGVVHLDSAVKVMHYPRETLGKFLRLCYNYGVARGVFVIKHRSFSAMRQVVPVLFYALLGTLTFLGREQLWAQYGLIFLGGLYLFSIVAVSNRIVKGNRAIVTAVFGFIGCHLFWTLGLVASPVIYVRDLARSSEPPFMG